MSRLYEALKEASRRRGSNSGGNGLLEYWRNNGMEIPPGDAAVQTPQNVEPPAVNGHSEKSPEEAVSARESDVVRTVEEDEPIIPLNAESDASLDCNARLIPFAMDAGVVEHYRRLRTKILQQQEIKPFRTLVVTSAGPQEGKTVTVLNLGLSFSTLPSFRVLVIDGDMRRGTLGNWLGVGNDQPGLSNLLEGSARLEDVVLKSDQVPMHFMVRGNAKVHDLHPSHFANHFQRLGESFDLVLVDSPPANLLVDVQMLAANTDAVLLVARAFSTSRKAFERAVQELSPFRMIGAVLNAGGASAFETVSRILLSRPAGSTSMKYMEYQLGLASESPSRLEIGELRPGGEDEWDRFVIATPAGSPFHLSGWKTVVEKSMGRRTFCLTARDESGIRGIFPISWVRSRLFGDCLVSTPLAVYGGICAGDREAYFSLLKAGQDLAQQLGVKYLEMRNRTEPFPTDLPGRDLYVTFTQDLTPGADKLMQALPRDTRYAIRKSIKSGLEWTEDLPLREFYEIYAQSVHRLGTPVFSRSLFEVIASEFSKQCRVFAVRKAGRAIAGVLCLYFRDQVLPYYAGALPEFYKDSPNNFMYWSLIAQSCKEGFRLFDFGRSKRDTGSFHFKSAWSMEVTELPYRYSLAKGKEVPHMSPVDAKFQLPVRLWKRMPFALTKIIGPQLIRRIPSV